MKMGEEDGVEGAAGRTGRDQTLRRAGAAIDQKCLAAVADKIGGPQAVGIALRTARAEQGDLELVEPLGSRDGTDAL